MVIKQMKKLAQIVKTFLNVVVILWLGGFVLALFWLVYFLLSFASLLLVLIARFIGEKETWSSMYDMLAVDLQQAADPCDKLFAEYDEKML